jgi:amidase
MWWWRGAVVFGKTNVPPGAFDRQSYNEHYGVSRNPWNPSRTPGGSPGGAAAAVAAGFTALELGSDRGGSVREPASFCGVYGHKPSYGVIPIRGHIAPLPGQLLQFEMGVLGPLAQSAHDIELAMDVLAAPAILGPAAWRVAIPPSRHERLEDFRVAVWLDDTYAVDDQYRANIEAFLEDLGAIGVRLDRTARPEFDPASSYETYLTALLSIAGAGLPEPAVQALLDTAAALPADTDNYVARFARALTLRHVQYLAAAEQRAILRWAWRAFFTQYDLVIAPTFPTVAYEHDHRGINLPYPISAGQSRTLSVSGEERPYFDSLQWPSLAVVADLPATAIPTGKFVDGMPVGVQLIAPFLEDRTSLRFAQLVERELGGAPSPPACV